ncbi:MAG: hypothetical protein R3299_07355 [Arenibacter sp.]|nr:hypothetical protein [Arenibacter sp.]
MSMVLGWGSSLMAQKECSLGIGVSNMDTVEQVFQLNAAQKEQLQTFHEAVGVETKLLEEERKELFKSHPQTTPEDFETLEAKRLALENKVKAVFTKYDRKFLALLNEKQYQRYLALCREVERQPIKKPGDN